MNSLPHNARINRLQSLNKFLIAATLITLPSGVFAQGMIEEVVVVATKREQSLQDVPVAVSVVSADEIERSQVLDIKDLQTLVPSLRVTQLQSSAQTNFIIRGFGNGANNAGIEPSVGVFIDGVYRSRVGSALADLPKLERVEVLRGPQSTLFGKNASAGVINVVTAKPDLEGLSGSVGTTLGNYNQVLVRGDITGPLTDDLAFSLYGSSNHRDGYYDNIELGTEQNELDRWNLRGQLLWTPSDVLEVRVIADADSLTELCCGVANLVDGPTGDVVRALGGNLVAEDPFAYAGYYDFDSSTDNQTQGISLQIDRVFPLFTVTAILAYRELDQVQLGDVDYTSARLVDPEQGNLTDTLIDTFTSEIRIASRGEGRLDWMAGAFRFREDVDISGSFGYGEQYRAYSDALAGGFITVAEQFYSALDPTISSGTFLAESTGFIEENSALEDETISLFAQGDFHFSEYLTLTAGLNYTESDKQASATFVNNDVFSALEFDGTPFAALQPFQLLPPFVNYPNDVEDGRSNDDDVTYTLRLSWSPDAHVSAYAGVSTGFKASSWNLSRDSRPLASDLAALEGAGLAVPNLTTGTRFAGPEESVVYEIGVKAAYESVRINAAVFVQEIDGFQSNVFSGTGFNLANAGKQSVDGAEVDIAWAPLPSLRVSFAATYLDPLYDEFEGALGVDGPTDLSGEKPAGIPEWATTTSASYKFVLGEGIAGFIRIEHVYEDEVQVVDNVPASIATREVNTFNASAGLSLNSGVDINLWGRNLTNDEYLQSAFPAVAQSGSFSGYPNTPRTYGVTATYSF
jgi:iron complex outermembrane receptor protein